jgi:transposase-like protein
MSGMPYRDWPDPDIPTTDWIPVSAAARLAGVDPRTMRRWVDEGRVRGRVTPGGTRQVSQASVLAGFERETVGRARGTIRPDAERAAPDIALTYLAAAAENWGEWHPPPHWSAAKCAELLRSVESLEFAVADIREQLEEAIRQDGRHD